MSIQHQPPPAADDSYGYTLQDATLALETLDNLGEMVSLGEMIEYTRGNFDPKVIDALEKVSAAVITLLYDEPVAIWDFAKAAG